MRKFKVFLILVLASIILISLIGYFYNNNTIQVNLIDKLLMANKSPKLIREDQGSKLNRIIKIGLAGPEQLMKKDTLFF